MRALRRHLTYANAMVTLLAFVVLGGGTAVALDGSNTVFSDDIVNGEVRTADIADAGVLARKLAADSVNSAKVANDSLTPADLQNVALLRARTVRLNSNNGEVLLTVGRVRLSAFCQTLSSGRTIGSLTPVVDETGPVLVSGDDVVQLQPEDVQFVVAAATEVGVDAQERSFGILDRAGTSTTGVAAAMVDADTDRCVISVHALG